MTRRLGVLLALLTTFSTLALTHAAAPLAGVASRSEGDALVRRTGLFPHVDSATIDVFPNGTGAYPRLAGLADGSVLAVFTAFSGSTRILTVTRAAAGSTTFAALGEIARGDGDLDNPFLLQLANGDIVAAYRNHDVDAARNPTYYRITTSISKDGGRTWAFLSQVAERAATTTKNGLWEPFMRLSKNDGSLQLYYASENSGGDQDILMKSSTDNGLSWTTTPITVAGGTTTGRDGMPGCANFNDGAQKLMCVFETTEGRTGGLFSVKSVVSTDEGINWGQRSQVYFPTGSGTNAGAPQIAQTTDNNLVVSFMTDEDATTRDWPDTGVAFKIVTGPPVATGSWGQKTQVTDPQSSWPGLFAQSDGSVLGCVGHASEGAVCHRITFTTS